MTMAEMDNAAALRGRIGAYRLHATHDPRETTQAARSAFLARFEAEVDPDSSLTPTERARRATMARKAYFSLLAYRSSIARAKKAAPNANGTAQEVDDRERHRTTAA